MCYNEYIINVEGVGNMIIESPQYSRNQIVKVPIYDGEEWVTGIVQSRTLNVVEWVYKVKINGYSKTNYVINEYTESELLDINGRSW